MKIWNGIKSTLGFLSGTKVIKKQAEYLKSDAKNFKQDFSMLKSIKDESDRRIDEWNHFINTYQLTTGRIKKQYCLRCTLSWLLIFAMLLCLMFISLFNHYNAGIGGLFIFGLLYFRNAFRLYQIRHHQFCKIRVFLTALKSSFKEILPLSLPKAWQAIQNNHSIQEGDA